jgi:hypothetical protein
MADAIGLERVEALVIQQRLNHAPAGRIALGHGHEVGAEGLSERGLGRQHLVKGLVQEPAVERRMLQPAREPMADGILKPCVVQHGRIDETAKRRLGRADLLGLAPHLAPDGIVALDLRLCRREGLLHQNLNSPLSLGLNLPREP